eukprot:11963150-Alexandrium_andersonii.AAC.1
MASEKRPMATTRSQTRKPGNWATSKCDRRAIDRLPSPRYLAEARCAGTLAGDPDRSAMAATAHVADV